MSGFTWNIAHQFWNPFLAEDIDTIDNGVLPNLLVTDWPYEDKLKHLDLYSSYCQRQSADLITI